MHNRMIAKPPTLATTTPAICPGVNEDPPPRLITGHIPWTDVLEDGASTSVLDADVGVEAVAVAAWELHINGKT